MRKYLSKNGSTFKKFEELDARVLEYFLDMRQKLSEVHDRDLTEAALKIAEEISLENFKASETWLRRFKKKYRIVSRKINAFVTLAQINNKPDLEKSIEEFRKEIKDVIHDVPLEWIFNADQTGIKQEMHFGRTLAIKGEKKVEAVAQRINATKHSYTAQVVINAEGHLMRPMLVVFCEPNKPKCFEEQLAPFTNMKAVATKSGLMDS
uniref:HTH CENPB-type domain-containing protein n=1 Tax=Panagrolaimus sp. ES5 TaxID=591445 RepID=A0AC34GJU6_9BILA